MADHQVEDKFASLQQLVFQLYEHMPFGCYTLAQDGTFLRINSQALAWFGHTLLELRGKVRFVDLLTPASQQKYGQAFAAFIRRGDVQDMELELLAKDGSVRYVALCASAVKDGTGNLVVVRGVLFDISEQKRKEAELRIAAVAFESQEGMMVTDPQGIIIRVNRSFTRLTGYTEQEVIGRTPALLRSGLQSADFYQRMWEALKRAGYWQGELWNKRKDGELYAEWLTISAVIAPDGAVSHYVGTFSDITHNKKSAEDIRQLAYYDPLTKLPNRTLLSDRLNQALESSSRTGQFGALLFMDLDNFKRVNDTLGHAAGDLLLVELASRLLSLVRKVDTVARLGGDEFVVILDGLGVNAVEAGRQARLVGEKILDIMASPFMLAGQEFYFTLSIGISMFQNHGETVESLYKHADMAMYEVKNSGRNALRFFDPAMQVELNRQLALEVGLHKALANREFSLYYQAQLDSEHRIIGAEALIRWRHPVRGLLAPDEFIPLAEESELIFPIGHWVLEEACAQIKCWSDNPVASKLELSINVSARQLHRDGFIEEVLGVVRESGIDPTRLKLELTESMVLQDVEASITKLLELRRHGIRFSLDDFGTGYSSLSYLRQLPIEQLKIDASFVQRLTFNEDDAAIVKTIIMMGRALGLKVIAEGVETEAQQQRLAEYGCLAYQGYLFAKPVPLREFEALL